MGGKKRGGRRCDFLLGDRWWNERAQMVDVQPVLMFGIVSPNVVGFGRPNAGLQTPLS